MIISTRVKLPEKLPNSIVVSWLSFIIGNTCNTDVLKEKFASLDWEELTVEAEDN